MKENILQTIDRLFKKGEYQHILGRYVDRDFWISEISKHIPTHYVENLTDFNYSTCFTMFINVSNTESRLGTIEFEKYIVENSELRRVMVQISALAPYAVVKFMRYKMEGVVEEESTPFHDEDEKISHLIFMMLQQNGITPLQDNILELKIDGVSLELKEDDVTVYNCLFEDGV